MNDALLVAVQAHPGLIVTDTLPVVAASLMERLDGDSVTPHEPAAWEIVNVC